MKQKLFVTELLALALRAKKRNGFEIILSINYQQFPENLDDIIEPMQEMVDMVKEFRAQTVEKVSSTSAERVHAWDISMEKPSGPTIMLGRRLN